MISLIAALDGNFLIGNKNRLPWHYKEDLNFFKQKTFNKDVLMGFKTYESLKQYYKKKSFPFKNVYIASLKRNKKNKLSDGIIINDLKKFVQNYFDKGKNIIIIGGSQIYKFILPYTNIMYLTHVLRRHDGDSFFPNFNYNDFFIKEKKVVDSLIFVTYISIKNKIL
ncbi:dihydrofolate reductase [Texas Phoenix palm phytoplasma]|uniref:dihydrofolate reductase n=1 Tax=Texas Phoenix palm phytoplasma TaxID=176709 RepID=A0ABS5BIQ9_9MOLU|nr:dihydrofolate reductase [Texas Phoenix palm phytoplasma]MBP3059475.1 dihydrofolate reductase [Texas Phoenix palm phytoplasma]